MQSANLARQLPSLNKPLSDELLSTFHPLVKLPLTDWIQYILDSLNQLLLEKTAPNYPAISACFKQTALIAFHFGQVENAFTLCHALLEWLSRLTAETGRLELAVESFDPWLNLGRLERLIGHNEAARQRFEIFGSSLLQDEVSFGAMKLNQAHWKAIATYQPDFQDFIKHNYQTEMLKTRFKSKNYRGVLDLVEDELSKVAVPLNPVVLAEAKFVALCRMGQPAKALAIAQEVEATAEPKAKLRRFIFKLRRAEAQAYFEDLTTAAKLAGELALVAHLFQYDKEPKLLKATLNLRVAKLLASLGQEKAAVKVAETGFQAAKLVRDEPLQLDYLVFMTELEISTTRWREALMQQAEITCYKMWRDKLASKFQFNSQSHLQHCENLLQELFESLIGLAGEN